MVKAAIIAVGSEFFTGSIVDTNSSYIAKKLSEIGVSVDLIMPVPDNIDRMVDLFKGCFESHSFFITTGGLGPTFDDLTAEAIAKAVGVDLEFNETAYRHIESLLSKRGVSIKESHKRQALLPKGAMLLPNDKGTAMGFICRKGDSFSISMPGIPYEMKGMFTDYVIPFLKKEFALPEIFIDDIRFAGLPESDVDEVICNIGIPDNLECIINVSKGEIIVRVRSNDKNSFENFINRLVDSLKSFYIGRGEDSLGTVLFNILKDRRKTISFAESCTGGLLSKMITDIPGASAVFKGSIVSYANDVKVELLGVPEEVIKQYGAVSKETVLSMIDGCKNIFGTDVAVAITGIAGPAGGTNEKPVGLVYTAIYIDGDVDVREHLFSGDREAIRERAAKYVFDNIIKRLTGR